MPPSLHQPKNRFGHAAVEKRWHVKVRLADGHIRWHGVFEDRDDFDAFLWAIATGSLDQQPDLWRLPIPQYFPDYGEGGLFMFAATIIVTASGSQSVPGDWNNAANTIEGIGGGGSGGAGCKNNGKRATGGSGAEYRKLTNYAAGGTFTYTIGAGGAAVALTTDTISNGNDGGDTILDTTALIAKKGLAGTAAAGSNPTPPAGGTGGTGGTGNNGGGGGSTGTANDCASGGGGAGGTTAAGSAGVTNGSNNTATNGGAGGTASGGAAGTGTVLNSASTATGGNGGDGSAFDATHGAGGGGGAALNTGTGAAVGGNGGNYGAGGGGSDTKATGGNSTSGAGAGGILFFTYTPTSGGLARNWGYIIN